METSQWIFMIHKINTLNNDDQYFVWTKGSSYIEQSDLIFFHKLGEIWSTYNSR